MSRSTRLLLACVLVFAVCRGARGQTARFAGQVTDPQNAAIPDAEVRAINQETLAAAPAKTDAAGAYVIPYLPAGRYKIEVQAPGFSTSESPVLLIAVGQSLIHNVQLSITATSATVNVEAGAASAAVQVNTENAEVAGTITGKEVTALQLNGRNFTQLIALVPGVSNQTQQDEARVGGTGSVAYSVNGGRTEYNSFNADGSELLNTGINKDHSTLIVFPSVDSIQEIKVLTSNYGAQYPSTGNGTTIVTTKSGGDSFHGNLYEFIRNEAFNAKGYFDVTNGPPEYRRNDFGGTIGGPVILPRIYDGRGKTHFFFSEEARLETDPYAFRQAVPSLAERNGDFRQVCASSLADCPAAGAFVPVSPLARSLLATNLIPNPNAYSGCNSTSPTGNCYLAEVPLSTYYREELFRLDHALTSRTQAGFRYIHDEWDSTQPFPQYANVSNSFPTIRNRYYAPGLSLAARLTTVFSASFLNEFVASYTNSHITLADVAAPYTQLQRIPELDQPLCPAADAGAGCGFGSLFQNGFGGKLPGIDIAGNNAEYGGSGFLADTSYMPWAHNNPVYTLSDNLTKTLGRHNLSFGGQWALFQRNQTNGPIGAASGDVQGLATFSNEQSGYSTGNAFADFLTMGGPEPGLSTPTPYGGLSSFEQDSGQHRYYQRYQIAEPYIQDDWKVAPRLTLNAGIRLSLFGTYREKNHNAYNWQPLSYNKALAESLTVDSGTVNFGQLGAASGELLDASTGNPIPIYLQGGGVNPLIVNGIVRCGVNGVPDGCMRGHLWNWAPRVGFAWDPWGNGKTALRAGYGIFFEHGTGDEANTGSLEASAPLVLSMTQRSPGSIGCIGLTQPGCAGNGPGAFPLNVTAIPTKAVWSNVQQWSLSAERQITPATLAGFAYVGSKGTHLTTELEINQLKPTPTANNPFGPHEPFIVRHFGSQGAGSNGNGSNCSNFDGYSFHLLSGAYIPATSPAYVNLEAACYGEGAGGRTDPNALRQYAPGLGQIYYLDNVADSHYNAFQATLRHISGALTTGVAYTYSHSLDDASDRSDTTSTNAFNLRQNYASSNFDQRHLLHISYVYQVPLLGWIRRAVDWEGKDPDNGWKSVRPPSTFGGARLAQALFDKWEYSGLTIFESGIPFTVVNNGSTNPASATPGQCNFETLPPNGYSYYTCSYTIGVLDNAGVANGVGSGSYPDLVGSPHGKHASSTGGSIGPLLLNPGAFAAPRGLTFGTAGRNPLNNPRRWNFDMALQKSFTLPREMSLEFRAEAFNVFNHTQFRIYNPTLGNKANNTVSCYANSIQANTAGFSAAGGDGVDCETGSSFLHPVDAHRPRTIQFGLKLAF